MKDSLRELYLEFELQHKILHALFTQWASDNRMEGDLPELADTSYALREMIKFFEDTLSTLRKFEMMTHAKTGILYTQHGKEGPIGTYYCSAKIDFQFLPSIPKRNRDPESYDNLMKALGVPEQTSILNILEIHWKRFLEYYNERIKSGLPSLPGVDLSDATPTARVSVRKRKAIKKK